MIKFADVFTCPVSVGNKRLSIQPLEVRVANWWLRSDIESASPVFDIHVLCVAFKCSFSNVLVNAIKL